VSLPNERLNNLETSGGSRTVFLTCTARDGRTIVSSRWPWPLIVEEGFPPHIHQPAIAKTLEDVQACRLKGNGIDFSGSVRGRLPRA